MIALMWCDQDSRLGGMGHGRVIVVLCCVVLCSDVSVFVFVFVFVFVYVFVFVLVFVFM